MAEALRAVREELLVMVRAVSCDTPAASATTRSENPASRASRIASASRSRARDALRAALRTAPTSAGSATPVGEALGTSHRVLGGNHPRRVSPATGAAIRAPRGVGVMNGAVPEGDTEQARPCCLARGHGLANVLYVTAYGALPALCHVQKFDTTACVCQSSWTLAGAIVKSIRTNPTYGAPQGDERGRA